MATKRTSRNGNGDRRNGKGIEITPQQIVVAERLALGSTLTEAAAEIGVERSTVSTWLNHNLHFKAHYNARRIELWRESSERMRSMVPAALALVSETLNDKAAKLSERLRAAELVIKSVGLDSLILPDVDEADIQHLQIEAAKLADKRESDALFWHAQ